MAPGAPPGGAPVAAENTHSAYLIGQKVSNTSAAKFPVHEAPEKAEQSLLTLIVMHL